MATINPIVWTTPAGSLDKIQAGEPYNFVLQANTSNILTNYSIISGQLPPGLSLVGSGNIFGTLQGTIYGTPNYVDREETYFFTVRISTINNATISDRSFGLTVFGATPPTPAPPSSTVLATQELDNILNQESFNIIIGQDATAGNLGIWPDGTWIATDIIGSTLNNPPHNIHYEIVSGNLPMGLTLNSGGYITGYVNPTVLEIQNATWDIAGLDNTKFDFAQSKVSANFAFDVRLSTQNLPIVTTYNIIIERADFYNNANANLAAPYYHAPLFINVSDNENNHPPANIQLNSTTSDANYIYQFNTIDFENDPIAYQLISGNAAPYIVPSNLSINGNTGWLSGYINEDQSSSIPYQFIVRAFKTAFENSEYINNSYFQIDNITFEALLNGQINANSIFFNDYQTLIPTSISISDLNSQSINWLSNSTLGNIIIGAPSTLRVQSEVSAPFITTSGVNANAFALAKLVNVQIAFGGTNYSNGDVLTINGGTCNNVATLTVVTTGNLGQVTSANINVIQYQAYSSLPILNNNAVLGGSGNNAQFNLSFGVESVTVANIGQYYPGALIGFSTENETIPAMARATLYNGSIKDIIILNSGSGYQNVPDVIISSYTTVTNANPVIYSLVDGSLPLGLELMSNGMIVGRPSYQAISNNNYSYSFTVEASVGTNYPIIVAQNVPSGNASNLVLQEFQELTSSTNTFTINLISSSGPSPKTNLSLEFLLSESDNNYLQNLIQNVALVPNPSVYRSDDFYFGRCENYRLLIGYGINPDIDPQMIATIAKYHHDKRYLFTGLNWAQSVDVNGNVDYEVIYITVNDQFTTNSGNTFVGPIIGKTTTHPLTADTTQFTSDDLIREASYISMATLYPATLPNMVQQLKNVASDFSYSLLPSWMTSTQPTGSIIGYIQAIPLVYINPGQGQQVLYNIQQYINQLGIGLNNIDSVTDRYIWDESLAINWDNQNAAWISNAVDGFTQLDEGSQYLQFKYRNFMATQEVGEEF